MHYRARGIGPLCESEGHTKSNVDVQAPAIGDGEIIAASASSVLCTTFDVLRGSQGFGLPCW
jgi:hypothetical protein